MVGMNRLKIVLLYCLTVPCFFGGCTEKKSTEYVSKGTVSGKVYRAGTAQTIADVWIFWAPGNETSSSADGSYSLRIPVGRTTIRAYHIGYETKHCTLDVHIGTNRLDIHMTPSPSTAKPVIDRKFVGGSPEANTRPPRIAGLTVRPDVRRSSRGNPAPPRSRANAQVV